MKSRFLKIFAIAFFAISFVSADARADLVNVGLNRAELVSLKKDMAEVMVANPSIADIVVHGPQKISIIGKQIGSTNMRFFDDKNKLIREVDIVVGYDMPAIRRSLNKFFPEETISIDTINNSLAVSGVVADAQAANRAMQVVYEFVKESRRVGDEEDDFQDRDNRFPGIVNLLSVNSGQQVMLKVRIGEVQRSALKNLGVSLQNASGNFAFGTGAGAEILAQAGVVAADSTTGLGIFDGVGADTFFRGSVSARNTTAIVDALEQDGIFKTLAEPNLTTVSGETASFLAGGEFPILIEEEDSTNVDFKQFGVSLAFTPFVLSQNRIRLIVAPELSEIDDQNFQSLNIPSLTTRRVTTTVELAPGESFMIAGLIRDTLNSTVNEVPGIAEIPILSALFRSSAYQRNETELVISVTPYIVDPVVSNEIRLPVDEFREPSVMEMFFYGALASLSDGDVDVDRISQTPVLEGPVGYMVE